MNADQNRTLHSDRATVAAIYEDAQVSKGYLEKRMQFVWQRILHERQVAVLQSAIDECRAARVIEVAPGPGRLTIEVKGIESGVLVENSEEMLKIAVARLRDAGVGNVWAALRGDAFLLGRTVPDSDFDLAYTFRFVRHFESAQRAQLVSQLRDRLRPAGILVMDVVNERVRRQLDERRPRVGGDLPVYDATFTLDTFRNEMKEFGFEVLRMEPVMKAFFVQSRLSYELDRKLPRLVGSVIRALESFPSSEPLEWVAVCRRS